MIQMAAQLTEGEKIIKLDLYNNLFNKKTLKNFNNILHYFDDNEYTKISRNFENIIDINNANDIRICYLKTISQQQKKNFYNFISKLNASNLTISFSDCNLKDNKDMLYIPQSSQNINLEIYSDEIDNIEYDKIHHNINIIICTKKLLLPKINKINNIITLKYNDQTYKITNINNTIMIEYTNSTDITKYIIDKNKIKDISIDFNNTKQLFKTLAEKQLTDTSTDTSFTTAVIYKSTLFVIIFGVSAIIFIIQQDDTSYYKEAIKNQENEELNYEEEETINDQEEK